ncbi:hypothetical protein DV738_g4861, partial [Chaetothyriales sp. CBS 135597]
MTQEEYKLKDLTSLLDLEELGKVEAEVEGIEGGKVLVVKVQGEVHALNANSCFSSRTGDVEDAPAPYALNKFDLVEKDGGVYVRGKEADIKAGKRVIGGGRKVVVAARNEQKLVIVGGGSGAFGALLRLRELGYEGKITVLTNEEGGLPIDRTKLSKALITDVSKLYLQPQEWYDDGAIDIQSDTTVTAVDFKAKVVKTQSGRTFPYTKLILASGGTPKRLPLPGFKDLENIFVIRRVSDVQAIVAAKNIVIIGTSFIGMEAANALAKDNNVSLVGMEDAPLERVMGKQVGQIFQTILEKNGAKFYLGASVDSAVPAPEPEQEEHRGGDNGRRRVVGAVKLKDGTELKADLVILGVGVNPATEYLRGNPDISLEKDGNVYAIGDIATYPYSGPGGNNTPVRIEHWNVAQNAGRRVGQLIAAQSSPSSTELPEPDPPFIPIFWSALGSQLRYAGATPNGYDDLVIKGDPANGKFAAYYTKGQEVVAVASMGMDPVVVQAAELLRTGKMPTKAEIEGGQDPLLKSLL